MSKETPGQHGEADQMQGLTNRLFFNFNLSQSMTITTHLQDRKEASMQTLEIGRINSGSEFETDGHLERPEDPHRPRLIRYYLQNILESQHRALETDVAREGVIISRRLAAPRRLSVYQSSHFCVFGQCNSHKRTNLASANVSAQSI